MKKNTTDAPTNVRRNRIMTAIKLKLSVYENLSKFKVQQSIAFPKRFPADSAVVMIIKINASLDDLIINCIGNT